MGFIEVILNLSAVLRNIKYCKHDIGLFEPDVLVFIDYSGFNLRIAKWAKAQGYRTNYYISPQVWASREGRVEKIKRDIDAMYVILPFEKEFYAKHGFEVEFVGHPLLDAVSNSNAISEPEFRAENKLHEEKPIIALLPGSRKQEVQKMLSVMLSTIASFTEYEFVIAGAPSISDDFYRPYLKHSNVSFVSNKTYDLLRISRAALVTSGTATLETAIFKVPQVVCYKANWVSYHIAKRIITLEYISLVNLIMNKAIVTELIQNDLSTKQLKMALAEILTGEKREAQLASYDQLEKILGGPGASAKTAAFIIANT